MLNERERFLVVARNIGDRGTQSVFAVAFCLDYTRCG